MRKRSTEKSEEQYVSQQKSSFDKKETLVKILHCKFDICSLQTTALSFYVTKTVLVGPKRFWSDQIDLDLIIMILSQQK